MKPNNLKDGAMNSLFIGWRLSEVKNTNSSLVTQPQKKTWLLLARLHKS